MTKCEHCGKKFPKTRIGTTQFYQLLCDKCLKLPACPECGNRDIEEKICCGTMICQNETCQNRW